MYSQLVKCAKARPWPGRRLTAHAVAAPIAFQTAEVLETSEVSSHVGHYDLRYRANHGPHPHLEHFLRRKRER